MPESRNWADLPTEISNLISKKLSADLAYILSFRGVCKNWRSSVPLSDFPPQLPWLIECEDPDQRSYLEPHLRFYTLVGGDIGTISIPETYHGMAYYGSGHRNLLVSSLEDDLFLLNPLVGAAISLPKLKYDLRIRSPGCNGTDPMRNMHVSCNVLGADVDGRTAAVYHAEQNNWTFVDVKNCVLSNTTCCWDGKVFATELRGGTRVFDFVSGKKLLFGASPPEDEVRGHPLATTYLVESCGEILRVTWNIGASAIDEDGRPEFEIYKLHSEGGGKRKVRRSWVKVTDIGDQIVFLDRVNGFSLRAPIGFKGNCIYFLYGDGESPSRYDLGTGKLEFLPCPFKNCTWFIPSLG